MFHDFVDITAKPPAEDEKEIKVTIVPEPTNFENQLILPFENNYRHKFNLFSWKKKETENEREEKKTEKIMALKQTNFMIF